MRVFTYGKGLRKKITIKPQTEAEAVQLRKASLWQALGMYKRHIAEGGVVIKVDRAEDIPEGLVQ